MWRELLFFYWWVIVFFIGLLKYSTEFLTWKSEQFLDSILYAKVEPFLLSILLWFLLRNFYFESWGLLQEHFIPLNEVGVCSFYLFEGWLLYFRLICQIVYKPRNISKLSLFTDFWSLLRLDHLRISLLTHWLLLLLFCVELEEVWSFWCQGFYDVPFWPIRTYTTHKLCFINRCWLLYKRKISLFWLENCGLLKWCCSSCGCHPANWSDLSVNFEIVILLEPLPMGVRTWRISGRHRWIWSPDAFSLLGSIF